MFGISRKMKDTVGGGYLTNPDKQYNNQSDFCFAENYAIAIDGQSVEAHFPCGQTGGNLHCIASMVDKSDIVFINNKGVIKEGDVATCGHTATGSTTVFVS